MIKIIKTYKWAILMFLAMTALALTVPQTGSKAMQITWNNTRTMLGILPPILLLIGLLDVWVPKEVMIKYMGEHSGIVGLLVAFLLGSLAAGPLYAAFPIAAILLKKEAKLTYVLFFLGVWSSAKIPMVMFEMASFGVKFTVIHIVSNLSVFLLGAYVIEKILPKDALARQAE